MVRGKQVDLGSALQGITRRLDHRSGGGFAQLRVVRAWAKVAGDLVDSHTTDIHVREGELVVLVDSPAWATELSALSAQYQEAINKEIGERVVKSMRFAVSKKVSDRRRSEVAEEEAEKERERDMVESVPLSETELAQVTESVSAIPDEELRQAVLRATVADLEWKKGIATAKRREAGRGDS